MHKNLKAFALEVPVNDEEAMKKFNDLMNDINDNMVDYTEKVAQELGINKHDAVSIVYLRSRSRWTQEKEDHLIQLSKHGKSLPNVLTGEF